MSWENFNLRLGINCTSLFSLPARGNILQLEFSRIPYVVLHITHYGHILHDGENISNLLSFPLQPSSFSPLQTQAQVTWDIFGPSFQVGVNPPQGLSSCHHILAQPIAQSILKSSLEHAWRPPTPCKTSRPFFNANSPAHTLWEAGRIEGHPQGLHLHR